MNDEKLEQAKELVKYVSPTELFGALQQVENKSVEDIKKEETWLMEELYKDLKMTPGQAEKFTGHMRHLKHGLSAAVPLVCCGDRCPFYTVCKAKLAGIEPPKSKPCIVELNLLQYYRRLYIETFEVEHDDFGSFILVNELAELDMYDFRATMVLSLGDYATGDTDDSRPNISQALLTNVPHYDEMGNITHMTQDIHSAYNLKERLKNRKLKILELLVATRKEKYKKEAALGAKVSSDFADEQRKITTRIEGMLNEIEAHKTTTEYYEQTIEEMPIDKK